MDLYVKNGKVYINGLFQKTNLTIKGGVFSSLGEDNDDSLPELDAEGKHIVPGFIDIHTHGAAGVDVNHGTSRDLLKVGRFFASQGTTSFLASIATDSEENTLRSIDQICEAMEYQDGGAQLLGIHLEGPFLSPEYKGAMAECFLKKVDFELFERYRQAADGRVKYITVSPEVEGVSELIRKIRPLGIVISIGHSGADYETAMACIRDGAASSTHTFNGMKLMHQHFPSMGGAVLESDIYCEAICDGRHLHPGVVRLLLKTKGLNRVVAITDSMMATGLADGKYMVGASEVEVVNGDARLISDGMRAGSTLTTINALRNLVLFTGRSMEELIPLLTANPAALLKIDDRKGSIALGKDGDIVILDDSMNVDATVVRGKTVYRHQQEKDCV